MGLLDEQDNLEDPSVQPVGTSATRPSDNYFSAGSGEPRDILRQYFQQLGGADPEMAAAKETAGKNRLYAQLGGATASLGSALAGQKPNIGEFQNMEQQADAPVNMLEKQREKEVASRKLINDYLTSQTKMSMTKDRLAQSDKQNQIHNQLERDKLNEQHSHNQEVIGMRGDITDAKKTADASKADSELAARRARLAATNHSYVEAIRRGKNIQDLMNRYPNSDAMPEAQYNTLIEEISGLVNGGAPTQGGSEGMRSKTAQSKWNSLMSQFGGKPKGADLGKFIEEFKPYVGDVVNSSKKYMATQHNRMIDAFKSRLGGDASEAYQRNKAEVNEDYGVDSAPPDYKALGMSSAPPPGMPPEDWDRIVKAGKADLFSNALTQQANMTPRR